MAELVLHMERVAKDYGQGATLTRVLHGVDLEIRQGEFAALVGPSGSGKSTMLNLIGLLDRPTEGKIWIHGQETTAMDDHGLTQFRGRELGFIFQFHHLLPAFTAQENVLMPLYAHRGRPDHQMRERALDLLDEVGLKDRAKRRATDLSGGQQQRVAIARALATHPSLVLADEPTGNLDTHTSDAIFDLLRRFNREKGMTFLIVTHDKDLAQRCDRIVEVVDGRIVADHPTAGAVARRGG